MLIIPMSKVIIFDFDGVIHDTFEFHRRKIAEFTGVKLTEGEFRDLHNGNFFSHSYTQLQNTNWESYRDFIYESQCKLKIEKKIKETIIELSKTKQLFIISSGGARNIIDYLSFNNLQNIFKEVLGLESFRSKTDKFQYIFDNYAIRPEDCFFVTDTLGDILEANNMKVKTIAVDFGFHPRETLEKGQPYKVISNALEILEVI